ncbi:aminotransferase class IV, partial [Luminiphilus sp.]|nr:aminotransferase class IV [Luminiphilus sp.]
AEGSGENVFLVRNGVLYTPELTSCLEGITRDSIIRIAEDQGLTVREKRITRDEVYVADEAFFTGTAAEVVPIGTGVRGPITEILQRIYLESVRGAQADYADWLAPIA